MVIVTFNCTFQHMTSLIIPFTHLLDNSSFNVDIFLKLNRHEDYCLFSIAPSVEYTPRDLRRIIEL